MNPIDTLYAKLGRQQDLIENQQTAYAALLSLTADLLAEQIDPKRVMLNLTEKGWTVAPEGQRSPLPATINGLPVCVVAPSEGRAEKLDDLCAVLQIEVARLQCQLAEANQCQLAEAKSPTEAAFLARHATHLQARLAEAKNAELKVAPYVDEIDTDLAGPVDLETREYCTARD